MFLTTRALVLREVKYKEADKILTVLTEREGKMTVKARGAVRRSCKFGAAAQALCFSEMTLFGNAGKWSINEAETIEQFLPLRGDLASLALGTYFAEVLEAVTDEDIPNPELLQLGLNSLYALSRGLHDPAHIKAVFELKMMCFAGFEPQLDACPSCGRDDGADALFSLAGDSLHCRACPPGTPGVSLPLAPETLAAMRFIAAAPPKKIFSFALPDAAERQLGEIAEAYAMTQLERGFSALDYWKSLNLSAEKGTTHGQI